MKLNGKPGAMVLPVSIGVLAGVNPQRIETVWI
jgi:hypothetical protein